MRGRGVGLTVPPRSLQAPKTVQDLWPWITGKSVLNTLLWYWSEIRVSGHHAESEVREVYVGFFL